MVTITVKKSGKLRVEAPEGGITVVDANGNDFDLSGKTAFALCGCGASRNKPFCDGTHSKLGIKGAPAAAQEEEVKNA